MDNFILNTYDLVKIELRDQWTNPEAAGKLEMDPMEVAKCVLENQGMVAIADWENGKCTTQTSKWIYDCDEVATKSTTAPESSCDINCGTEAEFQTVTYDPNCYINSAGKFTDVGCDNATSFVVEAARQQNKIIKNNRRVLFNEIANMLSANANANQIEASLTSGTINGTVTEFGSSEWNANLLAHFEYTALLNGLTNYKVISGSNFWELKRQAELKNACCDDQGTNNVFGSYDVNFDIWMDKALGRKSTILFDPTCIGFQNFCPYTNTTPQIVTENDNGQQIWAWMVPDPDISFLRIDPVTGARTLEPLKHCMFYKKKCVGSNQQRKFLHEHCWDGGLMGGLYTVPTICDPSKACILEMVCA